MEPKGKPIQIGKFKIPEPCSLDWDELEPAEEGQNRSCLQCQKHVVDISGMTTKELEQAYKASGGKLCVAVNINSDRQGILRQEAPKPRWRFLRAMATSVSLMLMAPLSMPAAHALPRTSITHSQKPQDPPSNVPTTETNTLVSGVILRGSYETLVRDSLEVVIRHGGKVVSRMTAVAGFFHVDLSEKLKPKDIITIEVKGKTFDFGDKYRQRKYSDGKLETSLGNAQNLQISVDYTPPKRHNKVMGRMIL